MEMRVCKRCGRELPIEYFKKTRWGDHTHVCRDCDFEKRRENAQKKVDEVKKNTLSDFTPRELMQELAKRGYTGTLEYVEVHKINIENF